MERVYRVETLYLPSSDTDIRVETVYTVVILHIQNVDSVISEWRHYRQSGDATQSGDNT